MADFNQLIYLFIENELHYVSSDIAASNFDNNMMLFLHFGGIFFPLSSDMNFTIMRG